MCTNLPHLFPLLELRKHFHHVVERREVHLQQLMQVLVIAGHLQVVVPPHHALQDQRQMNPLANYSMQNIFVTN